MKRNPSITSHNHVNRTASKAWACFAFAAVVWCLTFPLPAHSQIPVSKPEEIEWTWEVRPPHPNPALPNVLLLGDSITRNYFPEVTKSLSETANVYLMAVSTSVGDPRLSSQIKEFAAMQNVSFSVVHFNNGMHGWEYTEQEFRTAFPRFLHTVRALVPSNSALVWATITPVKPQAFNGATNARIDQRNAVALRLVKQAGIAIDDQHKLMTTHSDLYEDTVHYGPAGAAIMGDQAAESIRFALKLRTRK